MTRLIILYMTVALVACGDDTPGETINQVDTSSHLDELCPSDLVPCDDEGATRCEDGDIATCRETAPGCLGWSLAFDCPLNQACITDRCEEVCPEAACTVPEALRCAPTAAQRVERCADSDGDGCLDWVPVTECPGQEVCSQGACADGCVDECDADGARCEEGGVVTCADHDGDGCLEWGARSDCPGGCVLGACQDMCRDECGEAGLRRCDGLGVEVCEDHDGCLQWSAPIACPGGTTCSLGACAADCSDECVLGVAACDAGGVVRCGEFDVDPCTDRGLPQACSPGESCSAGECQATCQDECTSAGARSCDGIGRAARECRQGDDDSCLEWVVVETCDAAEVCSNGVCAATCQDECEAQATRCVAGSSTRVERCGNSDGDACLEWSADSDCAATQQVCAEGRCAASCSDECTAAVCDGDAVVPCGELDGDGCRDRGTPVACSPGTTCADGVCKVAQAPAGVRIAEVLYQSEGADDDVFIEIGGPANTALSGFVLVAINGADGAELARHALSGTLDSAGRYVLAHPAAEPAIADWADATSAFVDLQNGPDNLLLQWAGVNVDALGYGDFGPDDEFRGEGQSARGAPAGVSLQRSSTAQGELQDSDDNRVDFALAAPTPGRAYSGTKRPSEEGDLIVTEIMIDPDAINDATGEWVELWNPTNETWDLSGCVLESDPEEAHTINRSLVVAPGRRIVVARSADPGFTPDYVYSGIVLSNDADAFALLCGGDFIDLVTWDDSTTGESWSLDPELSDAQLNDGPEAWCNAPVGGGGGDAGTPGAPNPPCDDASGTYDTTTLVSEYGSCDPSNAWQPFVFDGAPEPNDDATLSFEWWAVLCPLFAEASTIEVEIRVGQAWRNVSSASFASADEACSWQVESVEITREIIDGARALNGRVQGRFRIVGGCPQGVGCGLLGLTLPYNCGRFFNLEYPY